LVVKYGRVIDCRILPLNPQDVEVVAVVKRAHEAMLKNARVTRYAFFEAAG
jgi:hypothetical protein